MFFQVFQKIKKNSHFFRKIELFRKLKKISLTFFEKNWSFFRKTELFWRKMELFQEKLRKIEKNWDFLQKNWTFLRFFGLFLKDSLRNVLWPSAYTGYTVAPTGRYSHKATTNRLVNQPEASRSSPHSGATANWRPLLVDHTVELQVALRAHELRARIRRPCA